jgi:hypothetical protein
VIQPPDHSLLSTVLSAVPFDAQTLILMIPGRKTKPPHGRKPDGALARWASFLSPMTSARADPAIRPEAKAGHAGPSRSGESPDGHLGLRPRALPDPRRLSDGA